MKARTMTAQHGKLASGGWLQVPADIRRELGLADGDQVVMQVMGGVLQVRPARDPLTRIQNMLRPYAPAEGLVSEELIAERRADA